MSSKNKPSNSVTEQQETYRDFEYLSDMSKRDSPWDRQKVFSEKIACLLLESESLQHKAYADRIFQCADRLIFSSYVNTDGEITHKLTGARFCRFAHCQICKWRRVLFWKARFYESIPAIAAEFSAARFIFLTLTVKNCPVTELREQLKTMSNAWHRLLQSGAFKNILGFIRSTEVTRSYDGFAHPHYHCLLMVKSTYFARNNYLSKDAWAEYWQKAMRIEYSPVVDVRSVRAKEPKEDMTFQAYLSEVVSEVLKYAIKPTDLIEDKEWLFTFIGQIHKMRLIATGGTFKKLFKVDETQADLLLKQRTKIPDDQQEIHRKMFGWSYKDEKYRRRKTDTVYYTNEA